MNNNALKLLAMAVVVLITILIALEFSGRNDSAVPDDVLYPELKSRINDVTSIAIARHGDDGKLTIIRETDKWVVSERDSYSASVGKIREVLLAIADARILERKTSNPERYRVLGIQAPDTDDGSGVEITITGDGFDYALIIGNSAQSDYRYVRIADQAQGLLIDHDPDLPDSSGGWLLPDIVDIDAAMVRAVTINHPDGESIHIAKDTEEDSAYTVNDIPAGRELSYPGVVNGMANVLKDLTLEDVRKSEPGEQAVIAVFETFDGLQLSIQSYKTDDGTWIELLADETGNEQATAINERVAGWQYKIVDYKANLLMRHWEDILRTPDSGTVPE